MYIYIYTYIYLSIYTPVCLLTCLSIYLSRGVAIYLSIHPSFLPLIHLSSHLSSCLQCHKHGKPGVQPSFIYPLVSPLRRFTSPGTTEAEILSLCRGKHPGCGWEQFGGDSSSPDRGSRLDHHAFPLRTRIATPSPVIRPCLLATVRCKERIGHSLGLGAN